MARLRFERQNKRLSQANVGRVSGIAQPVVCQIENGRLRPIDAQFARLAAFFKVKPDDLLKDVAVLGPSR